jgi:tetratricopeptide (TPR) repeat protein
MSKLRALAAVMIGWVLCSPAYSAVGDGVKGNSTLEQQMVGGADYIRWLQQYEGYLMKYLNAASKRPLLDITQSVRPQNNQASTKEDALTIRGQQAYRQGDFQTAADVLKQSEVADPSDAVAHYLRANCLRYLGKSAEAAQEYQSALAISPSGQVADYSRRGLTQMGLPANGYNSGLNAVQNIADQTDAIKQEIKSQAEDQAKEESENTERAVDSSLRQEASLVDSMRSAGTTVTAMSKHGPVTSFIPAFSPEEIEQAENQFARDQKQIRKLGDEAYEGAIESGDTRQDMVDAHASYVETQLKAAPSADGFRMRKLGTDFYVQNFAYDGAPSGGSSLPGSNSEGAISPLMANEKSFGEVPLKAKEKSFVGGVGTVHGKLIGR